MPATAKPRTARARGGNRPSEPEPRPRRALLGRGDDGARGDQSGGGGAVLDRRLAPAEDAGEEARTCHGHGLQPNLLAETLAQHRPEIAEAVDEAEPLRLGAGPDRAGEERLPVALEPPGSPALDERHEHRVDLRLDALEAGGGRPALPGGRGG